MTNGHSVRFQYSGLANELNQTIALIKKLLTELNALTKLQFHRLLYIHGRSTKISPIRRQCMI